MDNYYEIRDDGRLCPESAYFEADAWFSVSGDADDFIFYGESLGGQSEK